MCSENTFDLKLSAVPVFLKSIIKKSLVSIREALVLIMSEISKN
jgi:hypothetical protein